MPTGYTAPVQDGKITTFREFAMSCARAFGACITMRDDPSDTEIPEAFHPTDYNSKGMDKARAEIERLEAMSDEDKVAAAQKSFEDQTASWDEYEAKKAEGIRRYRKMLNVVEDWTPPTEEHVAFKEFMAGQLTESIEFDGGRSLTPRPTLKPADQWASEALQEAYGDLAYHAKAQAEEIERTRKRNEWIRALRESLSEGAS